jgi:1-acyl-sn-glycerol-3-phosphate acyltransferase
MMAYYWLLRMVLHLFSGLLTCALIFPFVNADGRDRRIRHWSGKLLAICGVKVDVKGNHSPDSLSRTVVVANHISWLDIFVINSLYPCRFVAKSDIRDWPLAGWLCEKAGTIFIKRGKQRDVRRIYEGLVASLQKDERIAFFPEGKTSCQGTILPFHANLFEAAIEAGVPVQPCAVFYLDEQRKFDPAAKFIDEIGFLESLLMILRARGMTATLIFLPQLPVEGEHRRDLAVKAHNVIQDELGWTEPV